MQLVKLAFRNLFRNARRTLITLSAIGSGLGLVLMMVGMQAGQYAEMLRIGISTLAGHVVVQADGWQEERDAEQLLEGADGVTEALVDAFPDGTVTPRLFLGGLVTSPYNASGVALRGVVPSAEATVDTLDEKMVDGEWLADDDDRGIVMGAKLAEVLKVEVGDKVVYMGQGPGQDEMASRLFRVRGLYRTGGVELDGMAVMVTIAAARDLIEQPDVAHQVALHLRDPEDSASARQRALELVGAPGRDVLDWPEALPELVHFIRIDRVSGDAFMTVMGLIVAMGVLNTVLMSVLERARELGVLMATGLRPPHVVALIVIENLALAAFALALGTVLGAAGGWYMVEVGFGRWNNSRSVIQRGKYVREWNKTKARKGKPLSCPSCLRSL